MSKKPDSQNGWDRSNRRNVLQTLGVGTIAAVTGINSVSASSEEGGAREEARSYIHQHQPTKAVSALNEAGIPHQHTEQSPPVSEDPTARETKEGDGDVSTDDFFTNPDSNSINTILFETATDGVWHLAMTWDLSRNSDVDGPEPTDGLILAWDDSHFKYDPGTLEYEVTHEYEIYGDTVIHTNGHELPGGKEIDYIDVSDGPLIGDYNNGIGFRIFDHAQESDGANSWWPLEQTGFAEIDIERQADGPANVQTLFEHTWSIGNVSQFDPIFNTSISKGASSVDISVPFEADSWSEGSTEEIPDNN